MEHIYSTEHNRKLLLYHLNSQIHLRTMNSELIGRPTILCSDFARDLTSTIYNGTIYYAYVNTGHNLLVKSITEPNTLFKLENTEALEYFQPQILVFNKQLLLFYTIQNPVDHSYSIKCVFPFQNDISFTIPDSFPLLPKLMVFPTDDYVFINIYNDFYNKILQMDSKYHCNTLGSRQDFTEERSEDLKQKIEQLEQQLEEQDSIIKERDAIIEEQQSAIKEQDALLQEKENALRNQSAMIESAKKQYNELMDVASQYREEAIKWRSKFM